MEPAETLQELWNGFNTSRVAYLDLRKMSVGAECGVTATGPCACLAGDLHLVPGQFGTSSQACPSAASAASAKQGLQPPEDRHEHAAEAQATLVGARHFRALKPLCLSTYSIGVQCHCCCWMSG